MRTRWARYWILCPNHVGIADSRNQWWMDVLENGRSSRYASYFDIDWEPRKFDLRDKVLLPILSDQYGHVLERGELQVRFEEGMFYSVLWRAQTADRPGNVSLRSRNCFKKSRRTQGRGFLCGIAKHSDRARILAEAHRS